MNMRASQKGGPENLYCLNNLNVYCQDFGELVPLSSSAKYEYPSLLSMSRARRSFFQPFSHGREKSAYARQGSTVSQSLEDLCTPTISY